VTVPTGIPRARLPRARLTRAATFVVASVALLLVFVSAGVPIPLYGLYRAQDAITDDQLAIATVTYLAATACSLLVLGRLSDHLGRRPVALGAVLASLSGCLVLLGVDGLPHLLAGRVLQGVACGVASSAIGSLVVDTAPSHPRWLPAVITGTLPPFSVPLGALVSGLLADVGPAPRTLGLSVAAGALAVVAVGLAVCTDPREPAPGALRSLRPRVVIPGGARRTVVAVGAALVATWSVGGFYQAFGPAMATDRLGSDDSLTVAVVFSSIVLLSPLGGALAGRLSTTTALRVGLVVFVVGSAVATGGLAAGSLAVVVTASLVAGVGNGAAASGAMRQLLRAAHAHERAGTLATAYLMSYAGAAVPGLVAGRLAAVLDVQELAVGYAALATVCATIAIVVGRRADARPTQDPA
jgi:MFS family permease